MKDVQDKVIIVTGASAGIGLAIAKLLGKEGARLALVARSKDKLEALAAELPGSLAVVADMTKADDIKSMIQKVQEHFGRIDVLINNAGQGMYGAIESVDIEKYKKIIELNVIGPLAAMQQVIPVMRKQGGGSIINISSGVSKNYFPLLGAYASTKYALNCISLTARAELEKDNIVVSVMHPGLTDTDFGKNSVKDDEASKMLQSRFREGMPQPDTAEFVAGKVLESILSGKAEVAAHDK